MKKLFLLMAAFILSIPTMLAMNVGLYVSDGTQGDIDDPYQYVTVFNDTEQQIVSLESGFTNLNLDGVTLLNIRPADLEYQIVVEPTYIDNEDCYDLYDEDGEWFLTLYNNADGSEFTVWVYPAGNLPGVGLSTVEVSFDIVEVNVDKPLDCLTIQYFDNSSEDYGDWDFVQIPLNKLQFTTTIPANVNLDFIPKDGYKLTVTSDSGIKFDGPDSNGVWSIYVSQDADFVVTVEEAPATFNLEFTTTERPDIMDQDDDDPLYYNAYDCVSVTAATEILIKSNETTIEIPSDGLTFNVSPKQGYSIESLTVTNGNGVEVSDYSSVVDVVGDSYDITITEAQADWTFLFNVVFAEPTEGYTVTVQIFEDGIEPEELEGAYTIWVNGEVLEDIVDNTAVITLDPEGTQITILPEGIYVVTGYATDPATYMGTINETAMGGLAIDLSYVAANNNLEIYAMIGIAATTEPSDPVQAVLTFNSDTIEEDVYKYVTVTSEKLAGGSFNPYPLIIDGDEIEFSFIPTVTIGFEPEDGYSIENINVMGYPIDLEDPYKYYKVVEPSKVGGVWSIALFGDELDSDAEALSISVQVAPAESVVNNITVAFTFEGADGIDTPSELISLWVNDEVIEDIKDEYILEYSNEATQVVVRPNMGYKLEWTVSDDSNTRGYTVTEGNDGALTFELLDDGTNNGLTFTITVSPVELEEITSYFTIEGADGIDTPLDFVTVWIDDEPVEDIEGNEIPVTYSDGAVEVVFQPARGYYLSLDTPEVWAGVTAYMDNGNLVVNLYDRAVNNGAQFTVTVAKVELESITSYFTIEGADGIDTPLDFVTVWIDDEAVEDIEGNEIPVTYSDGAVEVVFQPARGYYVSLETPEAWAGVPAYMDNGNLVVNLYDNAVNNGAQFTVTVASVEVESVTVNINLEGVDDAYEHIFVTDNITMTEITLESDSFQYSYEDEEGASFNVVAEAGYMFDYANTKVSEGSMITIIPVSSREFNIEMPLLGMNNGATITIALTEAVAGENIPVAFDIVDYPGLIGGLFWNGKETVVTSDSQLDNFIINMPEGEDESDLLITYATDEDGIDLYIVNEVVATYVDAEGEEKMCDVMEFDGYCIVTIPVDAISVNISFDAKVNPETGIDSIFSSEDTVVYNLQGLRINNVENLKSGIYIINGKKVFIRK